MSPLLETPNDYVSIKVSKTVGLIAKLRHFVPQDTGSTFFIQIADLSLSKLWNLCSGQSLYVIIKQTADTAKARPQIYIFNDKRDGAIPLFVKSKVLPFNLMYCQSIANLTHDVVN